jgi:DNA-binding XRE family transcriptional regulator
MNNLFQADSSFPAWLTLTAVWQESMDDPAGTRSVIGGNLSRLREKRRLSRRSLARLAGASAFTLQEIEAGRILPDIGLICRLADVLDVPSAVFLADRP